MPFGVAGRYLLRDGIYERNFGLKVALNLVFAGNAEDATGRIQSVDTTRLGSTSVRARRQASRVTTLEEFDVDRMRDLLRNLVVRPTDTDTWGSRVVGGDAAKIAKALEFADLGDFCTTLDAVARRTDYRKRVPWVDDVKVVQQRDELAKVRATVVDVLGAGDPDDLFALAPPEILDWGGVSGFQYPHDRGRGKAKPVLRPEPELSHYIGYSGVAANLTHERLVKDQLSVVDGDGGRLQHWSIWRCLAGAIEVDGRTYVLDDGDVFEVDTAFLAKVDRLVDSLSGADIASPEAPAKQAEAEYNGKLAASDNRYLLLDRKLLPPDYSTPIEVCDVASLDRQLIHVKRGFGSEGLNHLCAQGQASAVVLATTPRFRGQVEALCAELGSDDHAALFDEVTFVPSNWSVVLLVIANWKGWPASKALPFLGKLTLYHTVVRLQSFGYEVRLNPAPSVA